MDIYFDEFFDESIDIYPTSISSVILFLKPSFHCTITGINFHKKFKSTINEHNNYERTLAS